MNKLKEYNTLYNSLSSRKVNTKRNWYPVINKGLFAVNKKRKGFEIDEKYDIYKGLLFWQLNFFKELFFLYLAV